jgi:hypothetical protein
MFEAIQLEPQALGRGRPIKVTPERMQQISNLVERGKSPDQIAEIIGITTDTLQVACWKLGISLRRHIFNTGAGLRSCSYRRTPPHQASPCEIWFARKESSIFPGRRANWRLAMIKVAAEQAAARGTVVRSVTDRVGREGASDQIAEGA